MKRWTTRLGKTGIVLLHVGLVLLLLSFISHVVMGYCSGSGSLFQGQIKTAGHSFQLCPLLQELEVTATAFEKGGSLTVYLLETDNDFSYNTMMLNWTDNSTAFQEFLREHPDKILWEDQIENGFYKRSFVATKSMNVTAVLYNPQPEMVTITYKINESIIGHTDATRTMSFCATPLGVLFVLPWQLDLWKQRKHKLA
ncbi:MAG: hypothetical protein WC325_06690 [Candidatus Bathyarchaeia archaeon]